ncbi:hypothetical protein ACTHAM_000145 [Cellulomonas soli]|uniref:hypothetical protein n=1 Tax=Cellulomonas soli TaxID=931535 RepID=UPI003F86B2D7
MKKFTVITSSTTPVAFVPRPLAPIGARFQGRSLSVTGLAGTTGRLRGYPFGVTADPFDSHGAPLL